jgi:hypothetical protein
MLLSILALEGAWSLRLAMRVLNSMRFGQARVRMGAREGEGYLEVRSWMGNWFARGRVGLGDVPCGTCVDGRDRSAFFLAAPFFLWLVFSGLALLLLL